MSEVTVVDYGTGNMFNVVCALRHCGMDVNVTPSPSEVGNAKRLILPGVGAFGEGMIELRRQGLVDPLIQHAKAGKPLLGICLGMQMLLDESEEFGLHEGLRIIPGRVVRIPDSGTDGRPHPVPHVGWSELLLPRNLSDNDWSASLLDGIAPQNSVFFVHSYYGQRIPTDYLMADCHYHGRDLPAVIRKGSVYGVQFHPEKSGPVGLKIIKNFLSLGDRSS